MNKIILFGGSFDPIHIGHTYIAKQAINFISANKLFFVLCYKSPNKKRKLSNAKKRLDMLKIATIRNKKFGIIDYEIKNKKNSYTIDLLNWYLKSNDLVNNEIYFLIGEDQYLKFHLWKDFEKILSQVKIIVYPRFNHKIIKNENLKNFDNRFIFLNDSKIINTSSTLLRLKPKKKYLNSKVLDYINLNGLYILDRLKKNVSNYRYKHSIRVKNIGMKIANSLNLNKFQKNQVYTSCLYHDYCKEMNKDKTIKISNKLNIINYPSWKVLHGYVAAYFIHRLFFIDDKIILQAIEKHTIIDKNETDIIAKILYASDKLDIRNDWKIENYDLLIKLVLQDFNKAFKMIVETIEKEYV